MNKRKKRDYKKEVTEYAYINNMSIDGDIQNRESKINSTCNICGTVKNTSVRFLLERKYPCEYCEFKSKFENDLIIKYNEIPYIFLSRYKNMNSKIHVKCKKCGHEDHITPKTILHTNNKMGHPCKGCFINSYKKNENEFYSKLEEKFGKCNHTIINPDEYRGHASKNKIKFRCNICDHEFETYPHNVLNPKNGKHYCAKCNNSIVDKRPYQERLDDITDNRILALEEYKGHYAPLKHMCKVCGYGKDGTWITPPVNRTRGQGCPRCNNIIQQSKSEVELIDFIKSIYDGDVLTKNRDIIKPKELDIYIPDKDIAFEYCGLYWHNEKHKGKKYHLDKLKDAESKNIRLIQIFEDEWENNKYMVKQKIKHLLDLNDNEKIYARKCEIKNVNVKDKNNFLNNNHIQGKDNSSIRLGLYYNDELISVLTFGKLRKSLGSSSEEGQYELIRFASSIDKLIIGGFSKLLTYFIKEYNPKYIKTFADLRWSIGILYEHRNTD